MISESATILAVMGIMITVVGSVWSLAMWLSKQFSVVKTLVYEEGKQLRDAFIAKLEYHEKHDDQRFLSIANDLWDIRVRNAARDGLPAPISNSRYRRPSKEEDHWLEEIHKQQNSQTKEKRGG